jgi:hypothetical protein
MNAVSCVLVRKSSVSLKSEVSVEANAGIFGVKRSGRNQKEET